MWLDLRSLWEAPSGNLSLSIEPGSITFAGQQATFTIGIAQSTEGSISFGGQSVNLSLAVPITAGSITLAGQSSTFNIGIAQSVQGSITFQGQSVTIAPTVPITAGSITFAGQSTTATLGLALTTPGSITFDGQAVTLALAGSLTLDITSPGSITFSGQTVTLQLSGASASVVVDAGAAKRKRRYFVQIDGKDFEVESVAHAVALLDQAKSIAARVAPEKAEQRLTVHLIDRPKVRPKLDKPRITSSSPELQSVIRQAREAIGKIYADAYRDAEIKLRMEANFAQDDDDDVLMLL